MTLQAMNIDRATAAQSRMKRRTKPSGHAVRASDLLDAAEWCECLAAKLTLTAYDIGKPQGERMKANTERIALWEAATIMRREAANTKLTDCRRRQRWSGKE